MWFFQSPQAWVTISVLVWIYLNFGFRFSEYKLQAASNWTNEPDWLIHLFWPLIAVGLGSTEDLSKGAISWEVSESQYKYLHMFLWGPCLCFNAICILIIWLLWIFTWGRFHPIRIGNP